MKLIKPSFEIIEQKPRDTVIPADMEIGPRMWKDELINSVYRQIEIAGRTCYKSEDKITETSAKEFVDRMVKSGHGAMLEHGTVYLRYDFKAKEDSNRTAYWLWSKYNENQYSESVQAQPVPGIPDGFVAITTNFRVLVENNWLDDLEYICEPTEYHVKRITVKFICDRGVSHEFVRHRVFSFAQESTRYCNYSKDKFNNEVTFILPCWADSLALQEVKGTVITSDDFGNLIGEYYYHLNGKETPYFKTWEITPERNFVASLQVAEQLYLELLNQGWKPQQARAVLPNSLKTELIMTGTIEQWKGFFKLRDAGSAHPQAYELAHPLHEEFIKRGWIK
jgi:thymidylate synthase (FAD)